MGLSVYSALLAVKRIYVARMERQWYMGIVQMAGVRRLTTYGGASQWLDFKKKKSGSAEGASSDEQALFLAWMASMGRRQDSLFALDKDEKKAAEDDDSGSD